MATAGFRRVGIAGQYREKGATGVDQKRVAQFAPWAVATVD